MGTPESPKHFWTTMPAILTGVAALITALVAAASLFLKGTDGTPMKVVVAPAAAPAAPAPVPAAYKQDFLMAGMRVRCDKPSTTSFSGVRDSLPDSSPAARLVAVSVVQVMLMKQALEYGEVNREYECQFDDPTFYAAVVPLGPKAIGSTQQCRSYRSTFSMAESGGKRITKEYTACVENGVWTTQRTK